MGFNPILWRDKWYVVVALLLLLPVATEVGYLIGVRKSGRVSAEFRAVAGTTEAALLALVGLLLGFSFVMTTSRYETRKQLVIREANSIGTSYLRADVLPAADAQAVRALFRQYVDTRIRMAEGAEDIEVLERGVAESARIQAAIWTRAAAAAQSDPHAITFGLLLQSVNDVIDLHTQRAMAIEDRLPAMVLVMLFGVTAASLGVTGFGRGLGERRGILLTIILIFVLAIVLLVILDLDRPRGGFIRVSQQAMYSLRDSIRAP
jgi:hypothetical protein